MRRTAWMIAASLFGAALLPATTPPALAQQGPPHAWLFGSWTGGLFPAPSTLTAQSCLATPVIIFTRDTVLRATLTDVTYVERVIETARTTGGDTDFRFAPAAPTPNTTPLLSALGPQAVAGFGCEDPNVLHVHKRGDNEISFPNCPEFPNPLVRCPSR